MSILSHSRDFEESFSGNVENRVEFDEIYTVITDSFDDHWQAVLAYNSLWSPGAMHPEESTFRVNEFNCDRIDDTLALTVRLRYSLLRYDDPNPLMRPATFSIGSRRVTVPYTFDYEGKPIKTADGSLITDLTKYQTNWVIKITKNIPLAWPGFMLSFPDSVNASPHRIRGILFPKWTLQVSGMQVEESPDFVEKVNDEDIRYSRLQLEFEYDKRTFQEVRANASLYERHGYRMRAKANGFLGDYVYGRKRILDEEQNPIDRVQWLDAQGAALRNEDGSLKTEGLDPSDITFIEKHKYDLKTFSVLDPYLR